MNFEDSPGRRLETGHLEFDCDFCRGTHTFQSSIRGCDGCGVETSDCAMKYHNYWQLCIACWEEVRDAGSPGAETILP